MKLAVRVAVLCLAVTASASADPVPGLGVRDRNIITAENLFGSLELNQKTGDDNEKEAGSVTQRYVPLAGLTQLGYHRVISDQVTLGMNVLVGRSKADGSDANVAAYLRPRVGYTLPLSPTFSVWLRGGVLVAHERAGEDRRSALSGGADVLVALTPAPHVGLFGGLLFEAPLWGRSKTSGRDSEKYELTSTGLTVGALVDF